MSKGEGRSKQKCLLYVALFVVFQTAIILVFALTVARFKSPKVRFGAVAVENFGTSNTTSSASFSMRLLTQFTVKNTNFGHFKYDNSTLTILYDGMPVGEALIPKGRAKARKTQKLTITVEVNSDALPSNTNLGNDMNSGLLMLSSEAKLSGKIHLMKILKKKKSGEMSCTMVVNLAMRVVQDLNCK